MIHALPGMGANRLMFPSPWDELPDMVVHEWSEFPNHVSLPELAQTICERQGVRDGDVVIGASLGGMVACEIAKRRQLRALFLVGSAVRKEEINPLLAFLHPLAQVAPIDLVRLSSASIPTDLTQMLKDADSKFIRAMCRAIFEWEGLGDHPVPCYRLHGRLDLVIPPPKKVDLLLVGGHLISVTHATQCVEFIRTALR